MDFITIILFIAGFVLLLVGAEFLVQGAASIARFLGISSLVVGLTVVAYGTSAPEVAVTVSSTYDGYSDLAIGNVVGSNIANVLLVLGISATVAPLTVSQQLVRLDVPLMILLSMVLLLMGLDGTINWLDGLLLCLGAIAYTAFTVYHSFRQRQVSSAGSSKEDELDSYGEPAIYPGALRAAMRRYRFKLIYKFLKHFSLIAPGVIVSNPWLTLVGQRGDRCLPN
jgi:Ca2+/Na+ antiporter